MRTEQSAALKFLYPIVVRITSFAGIALLIFTFLIFPRAVKPSMLDEEVQIIIEQIDIPQTEQFDQPPPPARPSIPV
ncbi:MAG: energy transducer TonB, partial [Candidatus Marinimicrobia bacterium]|nr:energy transducer TonB [Candidatus Neomarinimicrobiota bacterium]